MILGLPEYFTSEEPMYNLGELTEAVIVALSCHDHAVIYEFIYNLIDTFLDDEIANHECLNNFAINHQRPEFGIKPAEELLAESRSFYRRLNFYSVTRVVDKVSQILNN